MDPQDIAIITITLARTRPEERLLERALKVLTRVGSTVATTDGGSPKVFVKRLETLGIQVNTPKDPGLIGQIQASLAWAKRTGKRFVLYSEPDKRDFFQAGLRDFIRRANPTDLGVALAARDARAFATFPPSQRYAERVINRLSSDLLRVKGDYSYGPLIFPTQLINNLAPLESGLGWGWRFVLFGIARRANLRLQHIPVASPCPLPQRRESRRDSLYRVEQLEQNLRGLLLGMAE